MCTGLPDASSAAASASVSGGLPKPTAACGLPAGAGRGYARAREVGGQQELGGHRLLCSAFPCQVSLHAEQR